jgi:isochorismate synthase
MSLASLAEGRAHFVVTATALPELAAQVAAGRARFGGDGFLRLSLPDSFDHLTLLRDLDANHVVASYEQPDRGLTLIGVGEAARVEVSPGDDPQSVRSAATQLLGDEPDGAIPELRPRLLGGFAFDTKRTPSGPWSGFPAGALLLPRLLFVREGGVSGVVVAPGVDPDEVEMLLAYGDATERGCAREVRVAQEVDREHWLTSVAAVASEVRDGQYEKAVLAASREIEADAPMSLGSALERLRHDYSHCHIFTITLSGATFIGASPELLVGLHGGVVSALGLAGSAPRSDDPAEDARLGRALLGSAKNRIEHEIVVRALREGLAPLTSDLQADEEPTLLRLRNIQHLSTDVSARALGGVDILELVGRLHPRPAVCGWPTDIALDVIRRHETFDRGWYAGPVGWMDGAGEGEFAVALRSALVRGSRAWLFAGAGIMGDSDPAAERAEIEWKFTPLSAALANGRAG